MTTLTDHSRAIEALRSSSVITPALDLAADLLEMHDSTSISLDNWESAKTFVETYVRDILWDDQWSIEPNHA
jgi:hypothetical protein